MDKPMTMTKPSKLEPPFEICVLFPNAELLDANVQPTVVELQSQYAQRSPYLSRYLDNPLPDTGNPTISLPEVDPKVFSVYECWLKCGQVSFPDQETVRKLEQSPGCRVELGHCLSWEECQPLLSAYVLACHFEDDRFRNAIIDVLSHWLERKPAPDLGTLDVVFRQAHITTDLKDFLVGLMTIVIEETAESRPYTA